MLIDYSALQPSNLGINFLWLLVLATNICLLFYNWKSTYWVYIGFRFVLFFMFAGIYVVEIAHLPTEETYGKLVFGYIPLTGCFVYMVINKKI